MRSEKPNKMIVEFTPLEKVEALFSELTQWYGDADKKELRVAAKLLLVALDQFAKHGGEQWDDLVLEYFETLKNDPEKFQKMLASNRGELRDKDSSGLMH